MLINQCLVFTTTVLPTNNLKLLLYRTVQQTEVYMHDLKNPGCNYLDIARIVHPYMCQRRIYITVSFHMKVPVTLLT